MSPYSTRRFGALSLAVLVSACADRAIAPSTATTVDDVISSAASDSVTRVIGVQGSLVRRLTSAVMIPNDTVRMAVLSKSSRSHRTSFTSTNSNVASVNSSGLVQARSAGSAYVIGTDGSYIDTLTVRVEPGPAQVKSDPASLFAAIGETRQLSAIVTSANGVTLTGHPVRYSSVNSSIASVSDAGMLAAKAAGSTSIVITDGAVAMSVAVTVLDPATPSAAATGFVVSPKAQSVQAGATVQFSTTTTWSDNATRASSVNYTATGGAVSATGLYTAGETAGTYRVIAQCACGRADTAIVTVATTVTTPPIDATTALFSDSFESGNISKQQNGVRWLSGPWTEVTSMIAHTGTKSVRFRQGESVDWAELRFDGLPNLKEVFVQYYLYMPSGNEQPFVGPRVKVLGGKNDKFFRIWGGGNGGYNATNGTKVGASLFGDGSGVDGTMNIEYMYSLTGGQWSIGEGWWGEPNTRTPFVTDANRGKWLQMRIRAKVASAANNDGVMQIWVNGQLLLNRTDLQNANISGSGPTDFTTGYLLGWANNGYAPGQNMFVDDFTISGTSFPN